MSCIQRLASRGSMVYSDDPLSASALQSIRDAAASESDPTRRAALQKAISVSVNGPASLDDAITTVNASITKQAINTSTRPDIQKIATVLSQSAMQATQNVAAKTNTVHLDV